MLMVETELRPSSIHGVGTFLLEDVKAGDLIWRFDSRIDRIFSNAELATMPERLQAFLAGLVERELDDRRADLVGADRDRLTDRHLAPDEREPDRAEPGRRRDAPDAADGAAFEAELLSAVDRR